MGDQLNGGPVDWEGGTFWTGAGRCRVAIWVLTILSFSPPDERGPALVIWVDFSPPFFLSWWKRRRPPDDAHIWTLARACYRQFFPKKVFGWSNPLKWKQFDDDFHQQRSSSGKIWFFFQHYQISKCYCWTMNITNKKNKESVKKCSF